MKMFYSKNEQSSESFLKLKKHFIVKKMTNGNKESFSIPFLRDKIFYNLNS